MDVEAGLVELTLWGRCPDCHSGAAKPSPEPIGTDVGDCDAQRVGADIVSVYGLRALAEPVIGPAKGQTRWRAPE